MDQKTKLALALIDKDRSNVNARLADSLGISPQAASKRLKKLVDIGWIRADGVSRSRMYFLVEQKSAHAIYGIEGLNEDIVWRELCAPVVADLAQNVRDIWHYGITEMVNNAIDHSGAQTVDVGIFRTALNTVAWVKDNGEGIFLKIQRAMGLYDPREAMLELAKGKFTTDPDKHTGEGIFFSSKMFDAFSIRSGKLHFMHDVGKLDMLSDYRVERPGTQVVMQIENDSLRVDKTIFDQFSSPDEYTFDRTMVPVRLAAYEGEKLVSRSQAKRLTARFERFRHVILDFDGVNEIGQAFADEVFRVFQNAHPSTVMAPVNMTTAVKAMVSRAHSVT